MAFRAKIPKGLTSKFQLMEALSLALCLPDYFGSNWDALEECITDLSWIQPFQVAIVHQDLPLMAESELKIYLDILRHAIAYWETKREHSLLVFFPQDVKREVHSIMK